MEKRRFMKNASAVPSFAALHETSLFADDSADAPDPATDLFGGAAAAPAPAAAPSPEPAAAPRESNASESLFDNEDFQDVEL